MLLLGGLGRASNFTAVLIGLNANGPHGKNQKQINKSKLPLKKEIVKKGIKPFFFIG